jgi:putative sigma-54 modulation protein
MKLHVTPRHLRLTPAIEQYIADKLGALAKISDRAISAHVMIGQDRSANPERRFTVSARLAVAGPDLHAEEHGAELYAGVDAVAAKLGRQLRKRKTKLVDHPRASAQRAAKAQR